MCCCGKPVINGQNGYKWNQPDGAASVYPVNPPALADGETLIRDEPGRCGGLDSHSHHYRLVRGCGYYLLVRHGGGDERLRLFNPEAEALIQMESTPCYWIMRAIQGAHSDGKSEGAAKANSTWRKAAAEKRIKTRKQRDSNRVKVWIEHADLPLSIPQSAGY